MNKQLKGILCGIIGATSYGTNPLFALPLYAVGIGVNSVLFYRYFTGAIIYFFILKFIKKISLKISFKEFVALVVLSLLFAISSITLFSAFKYLDSGIACTLLFIYPIIVTLIMSLFFNERITKTTILALILTSIGITLLYKGKFNETLNLTGIKYILTSAVFYALYIVGVKKFNWANKIQTEKMSFYVMVLALPIYIYNLKYLTHLQPISTPFLWLCILGIAIFPTIIAIEMTNVSIKIIGSTYTSILGALEPITAVFFGVLLFNEQLTLRIFIGIISVLLGVTIVVLKKLDK